METVSDLRQGRILDPIFQLVGIVLEIIKFIPIQQVDRQFIAPIENGPNGGKGTKPIMIDFKTIKLNKHAFIGLLGGRLALFDQRLALQQRRAIHFEIIQNGGHQIDMGNR